MAVQPSRIITPLISLLVCGGRSYSDAATLAAVLDDLHADSGALSLVITGGAGGADRLAGEWARSRRIALCMFPANWKVLGDAAGPIRNGQMLAFMSPDLVVAFPGGDGTFDMVQRARLAGVPVREVE